MAIPKNLSSIKRFGTRYGSIVKHKFALIENQQRASYKCPYCSRVAVRRLAAGIWQCNKCDAKFAGKAYNLPKKKKTSAETSEEELTFEEITARENASKEAKEEHTEEE